MAKVQIRDLFTTYMEFFCVRFGVLFKGETINLKDRPGASINWEIKSNEQHLLQRWKETRDAVTVRRAIAEYTKEFAEDPFDIIFWLLLLLLSVIIGASTGAF